MTNIEQLDLDIQILISYAQAKILQRDWHAVADSMMDIRELEAKKQVLLEINRLSGTDKT